MKKLLFLGIDTSTADALAYAKAKGVYTIITDYLEKTSSPLKSEADEFWQINVTDLDALEKRCRAENVTHIYAGSQELCLDCRKLLCERLGLPFYASDEGWKVARDKEVYKSYCQEVGLDVPRKYWIGKQPPQDVLDEIRYPAVVKPTDGNAKRGFSVVRSKNELRAAIEYGLTFSKQKKILVEDFIEGYLVTVFCYVREGNLYLMDIMIYLDNVADGKRRFVLGIHDSRHNKIIKERLMPAYDRLIKKLNIGEGTCFFQSILCDQTYYQLEMAYRLDGICSWRYIERLTGFNQLKYMVNLALGEHLDENFFHSHGSAEGDICMSVVYWGQGGQIRSITGKQDLYRRPDVIVQWDRFKEGDSIPDTDDMTAIALILEVFGKSRDEIREKTREINHTLYYYDETNNDLLIKNDGLLEKWEALQEMINLSS